ncbi:hypothetical protein EJB05_44990, partial [Eragrostis curvula]
MSAIKVKAKDMASSAKAGVEKAKATATEKVEKATTTDPVKKREAEERKKDRKKAVESEKSVHGPERRVTHVAGDGGVGITN